MKCNTMSRNSAFELVNITLLHLHVQSCSNSKVTPGSGVYMHPFHPDYVFKETIFPNFHYGISAHNNIYEVQIFYSVYIALSSPWVRTWLSCHQLFVDYKVFFPAGEACTDWKAYLTFAEDST